MTSILIILLLLFKMKGRLSLYKFPLPLVSIFIFSLIFLCAWIKNYCYTFNIFRIVEESEKNPSEGLLVDLGSDQTSCHNPFNGGYYPVQISFEEANKMMFTNPDRFKYIYNNSYTLYKKELYNMFKFKHLYVEGLKSLILYKITILTFCFLFW